MTQVVTTWHVYGQGFPRIAAQIMPLTERVVAKIANDLQAHAQSLAPVDTGTLKNSIRATKVGPGHWKVVVGANYGLYVEWGTRYMSAQPYMQPAVLAARPAFYAAMRKVIQ